MNVLLLILLLVILVIFIFYVVYKIGGTRVLGEYVGGDNQIWKSYPGKYEGMTNMTPAPVSSTTDSEYKQNDPFGLIDSSEKCPGSSYFSTQGNICLDANQKMLLTTRGGNATTGTKFEKAIA
jgi:hypothetical protein